MVREKDLGSSLLFFAVFAAMLYIATERCVVPRRRARHVRRRRRSSRTSSSATCRSASSPGSTRGRYTQTTGFQLVQSLFAFGSRRVRGHRPRPRQPAEDPERVDRLRVRRPSARSSAWSARSRSCIAVPAARRQRVPHRGPGRPPVLEAVRRRPHHDRRRPDVRDHRRRHPRDPADRHHAAVRLVRRLVARSPTSCSSRLLLRISDETVARRRDAGRRRRPARAPASGGDAAAAPPARR